MPSTQPESEPVAPKVGHCKRAPQGSFVSIGRPGRFGNPFPLADPTDDLQRDRGIGQDAADFQARIAREPGFRRAVEGLRGRDLGCWCAPRRCHGEVILARLAAHPPQEGG